MVMDVDDTNSADRQLVVRESDVRATIVRLEKEALDLEARAVRVRTDLAANQALLGYFPDRRQIGDTPSIRDMALGVLDDTSRAMGVREIIDAIEARFGTRVARTSLSPILKKMEGRGLVEHVGTTWIMKGKGPSAPTDGPTDDDRSSDFFSQPSKSEKGDIEMS
ncbi:hypothetical protein U1763_12565 [Sphingomonas sp. LB2R24]|uniref:hypothetical protein n=1 Tax=Sphingomonas sorbitolis TaxID=3096165 RepID=UPI002FC9862E